MPQQPCKMDGGPAQSTQSFCSRISPLSCVRSQIVLRLVFNALEVLIISVIHETQRHANVKVPFKIFLGVYCVLNVALTISLYLKTRMFFQIHRIQDYKEKEGIAQLYFYIKAMMLVWCIVGLHWVKQCDTREDTSTVLYNTSLYCVHFGFFSFIATLAIECTISLLVESRSRISEQLSLPRIWQQLPPERQRELMQQQQQERRWQRQQQELQRRWHLGRWRRQLLGEQEWERRWQQGEQERLRYQQRRQWHQLSPEEQRQWHREQEHQRQQRLLQKQQRRQLWRQLPQEEQEQQRLQEQRQQQQRREQREQQLQQRLRLREQERLRKEQLLLQHCTVATYMSEDDVSDGNPTCMICSEGYIPGGKVAFLPCRHHFHTGCICAWFCEQKSCPMCRKRF
ncbi:hypothetical protein PAPHI01_1511 [Pancytospora philotis]|nr:hypothetical protein PAPHI01_1511 [Pancytospora philotis]